MTNIKKHLVDQIPGLDLEDDYELPKVPIHLKRLKLYKTSKSKAIPGTSQLTKSPDKFHFHRGNAINSLPECYIRLERCDPSAAKFCIDKNPTSSTLSSRRTEQPHIHMDNYELIIDLSTEDAEKDDHVAKNNSPIFISSDDDSIGARNQNSDDEFLFLQNDPHKPVAKQIGRRRNTVHGRVQISTKKQKNYRRALNLLGKEANKNVIQPPVANSKKSAAAGIESHSQKQQNMQVLKRNGGSHIDIGSVEQVPSTPCDIGGLATLKKQLEVTEERLKNRETLWKSERTQWEEQKTQLESEKADLEESLRKKSEELDQLRSRFELQERVHDAKKIKCAYCQKDAVDTNFEPPTCSAACMRILW